MVKRDYHFRFLLLDHLDGAVVDRAQLGTVLQLGQDVLLCVNQKFVHRLDLFRRVHQEGASDVGAVGLVADAEGAGSHYNFKANLQPTNET